MAPRATSPLLYASLLTCGASAARPRGLEVGGEPVEFRVGGERLADPLVELVLAQPPLDKRGLERPDHQLAVGAGVGAASRLRLIAARVHHGRLLTSTRTQTRIPPTDHKHLGQLLSAVP